jgi:SRSO17 transposase
MEGFKLGEETEMDPESKSEARFSDYLTALASVIGRSDRAPRLHDYCTGLLLPGERKSVEPIAMRTAPHRVSAQHQSLLHFVGVAGWSDEKVLAKVRELVLPAIERHGPIEAWIVDDTSFPKDGTHSVGVQRQYCGELGKEENCQVTVSLSIANHHASLPIDYRLYLPQSWASSRKLRKETGIPKDIGFQTKPQIALEQIRKACAAKVPRGAVLMDAAYGSDARLRAGIAELGLTYVAAVQPNILLWPPGKRPRRLGKLPNNTGRRDEPDLRSVKEVALGLPKKAWRKITWREGSATRLSSRFARVRVLARDNWRCPKLLEPEWLLVEWPKGEQEPTKYWFSNLPESMDFPALVDIAKMRWRIERDYLELKQEVGLGHFEGRGWRGFHHHATLCIAAYGFLVSERETIPPSGPSTPAFLKAPAVSDGVRPRGSALAARTPHPELDRHRPRPVDQRLGSNAAQVSLLRRSPNRPSTKPQHLTQYD